MNFNLILGNPKLTSKVFDHVANNCKEIKYIYLRNCPGVSSDFIDDQLYYMKSLRKVYID